MKTLAQVRYIEVAEDDAGMRLDNYLRRILKDVPRSRIYRIIRSGEVRVNAGRARPSTRLRASDRLRLPPLRQRKPTTHDRPPDDMMARVERAIVRQTPDYIAFAKPAGMAVHAGSGVRFGLIEVLRAMRPDEYVELVHRLDRQTSGCLLVARSKPARRKLADALADPAAVKEYQALVDGVWPHASIDVTTPLRRDVVRAGERVVQADHQNGRSARTCFIVERRFDTATLMRATLATGRTHQIRVHAAEIGHPVAGDDKYAPVDQRRYWRGNGLGRQWLHATRLQLYTDRERIEIQAPLPDDLATVLHRLEHNSP